MKTGNFWKSQGYTFIELAVVILLLGIVMTITIPRFRYALLTDTLKSTARKMVGAVRENRVEAVRENRAIRLQFDLESNRYWFESEDMSDQERIQARESAFSLGTGVRILDIWVKGKGKKMAGDAFIRFNEKGYVQQSMIHLGSEDGRQFTLVLRPFLRGIQILDHYLEPADLDERGVS
jgi:prepilin-type N-terminal cleavage/methylation domain-containing protein